MEVKLEQLPVEHLSDIREVHLEAMFIFISLQIERGKLVSRSQFLDR
jgi:hypothetical protein